MLVLHEAPFHFIPRLVDGTDSLNQFRSPATSQPGRGDHAIADIGVDTGHQKCANRTEMPALFLDGCAIGFAFPKFSCRERTGETNLDNADILAVVADLIIDEG